MSSSSSKQQTPDSQLVFSHSLSRYRPIAQIARGGMAEVILAEMTVGRGVTKLAVLKRIWPDLARDREFVAMFLREARLGASMNHPNIVQTFEVLADGPRPAISMEYLDGQPLTRVLNRLVGPNALSWPLRLRILASVLNALDYAHELTASDGRPEGVVHRDVNPQNVFVTYHGRVKLVDFGVAKTLSGPYQTRPGTVKGKLAYMAPEQTMGSAVDRRADLFAVGVMLWEMAAERRLWAGMTEAAIVRSLGARVPIRPIPVRANLPHGLSRICSRALAIDPQHRYGTAAEFAADLEGLITGSDDSHGRHLGKVVSLAFAEEHAARDALIERHRLGTRPAAAAAAADQAGAGTEPGELEALRPQRATPGGMWTTDGVGPSSEDSSPAPRQIEVATGVPLEPSGSLTMRVPRQAVPPADAVRSLSWTNWGLLTLASAAMLMLGASGAFLALRPRRAAPASDSVGGAVAEGAEPPGRNITIAPLKSPRSTRPNAPLAPPAPSAPPVPSESVVPADSPSPPTVPPAGSARSHGSQMKSRADVDKEEFQRLWRWLHERDPSKDLSSEPTKEIPGTGDDTLEPSIDLDLDGDAPASRSSLRPPRSRPRW